MPLPVAVPAAARTPRAGARRARETSAVDSFGGSAGLHRRLRDVEEADLLPVNEARPTSAQPAGNKKEAATNPRHPLLVGHRRHRGAQGGAAHYVGLPPL